MWCVVMKKLNVLLIMLFFSFFLVSCNEDAPNIDNTVNRDRLFVVVGGAQPLVKVIKVVDGSIEINDLFLEKAETSYNYPVKRIKHFGNLFFFVIPQELKIEVFSADNLNRVSLIDFTDSKKIPSDICFANATTAYIAHENDESLSCLDLTNFQISGSVTISGKACAIECSGNQIFTANTFQNTVSIVDSRSNEEIHSITVADRPAFLSVADSGKKVVCVSIGTGKIDDSPTKTASVATSFDVLSSNIISTKDIGFATINPVEQNPISHATTVNSLSFVATKDYLLRFNAKSFSGISLAGRANYKQIIYNDKKQELIITVEEIGKIFAKIADQSTAEEKRRVLLPANSVLAYPL